MVVERRIECWSCEINTYLRLLVTKYSKQNPFWVPVFVSVFCEQNPRMFRFARLNLKGC